MTETRKFPINDINRLEEECGEWEEYSSDLIKGRVDRMKEMRRIGDKAAHDVYFKSQAFHIKVAEEWLEDIEIDL
jgi:hypothetical protein